MRRLLREETGSEGESAVSFTSVVQERGFLEEEEHVSSTPLVLDSAM